MNLSRWSLRQRLSVYLGALVGVIALLGGFVFGLVEWQQRRQSRARLVMSDYHLATQEASAAAQVELLLLKNVLAERVARTDALSQTGSGRFDDFSLDMRLHLIRYALKARVAKVMALQRKHEGPVFAGPVARIEQSYRGLQTRLDHAQAPQGGEKEELAYQIDSLSGMWEQLRRLHAIEFRRLSKLLVARAHSEEEQILLFLLVVLPASALVIRRLAHLARLAISRQEQAEHQYRELAEDLEHRVLERTAELRLAHEKLARKERLAMLGQLTGTVSHELRNPLSTLTLSVQGLRTLLHGGDPKQKLTMDRIERSIEQCNQVITELLDFSRSPLPHPVPTDLTSWLREVVGDQRLPSWLEVTYDLPAEGMVLHLDQDRLRRAIINVVDNAVQAMEGERRRPGEVPPMRLRVRCTVESDRLCITFADTGPGMPPDVLGSVFEPLFTTKPHGIGLGMPTVKQIMEDGGGAIEIVSAPGQGTEITLWLPLQRHRPDPA